MRLGYCDHMWKLEVRKSYPADFAFDLKRSGVACALGQNRSAYYSWSGVFLAVAFVTLAVLLCICRKRVVQSRTYQGVSQKGLNGKSKGELRETVPVEKETLLNMVGNS